MPIDLPIDPKGKGLLSPRKRIWLKKNAWFEREELPGVWKRVGEWPS